MSKKVDRAGVIPFFVTEDQQVQMMFMKPSDPRYGGPFFQCCKGVVEDDDADVMTAALREGSEELGLFKPNIIGDVVHIGRFLGRTDMFVCEIEDQNMFGDPHFETGEVAWMTEQEFIDEGRDLHVPMVQAAMRQIRKMVDEKGSA
jgi:8-oxo-dGTP pyrophosphatase MutT (NUDIX family)